MAASAGAWYRVGTVNVTNGSAAIVGVGSNWQNDVIAIAIGDAFTIDAKTWYEVISVNDDTSITLDRGFEGATASDVEYAILRNTSGTILTRIAGQIAVQFNQKQLFLDELRNWLTSEDETATLTDSHGIAHVVKTVNKIQELTGTAAEADVVSNVADTTANKVLTVGYGGLGAGAILTSNFDSLTVNGFYQSLLGNTIGAPLPGRQYSLIHNSYGTDTGNDRASQIAIESLPTTVDKFIYFRTREGGVWTEWSEVLTYSHITATYYDNTPGRITKVGDFGLGGVGAIVSSLNDINVNGMYRISSGDAVAGGAPYSAPWEVISINYDSNSAKQMAFRAGVGSLIHMERVKAGGNWQEWQETYHSGNTNFKEFGGLANDVIAIGICPSATVARLALPLAGNSVPTSITVTGTFTIKANNTSIATGLTGSDLLLKPYSGTKIGLVEYTSTGLVQNSYVELVGETESSKIMVNY
ncbi:MAG: hypothetical protein ACI8ZA_000743 [Gammaproteobacteria bacterium]|jgi:hypothetical protein